ncbi:MAG: DUF481 domain-containing protein [Pseudomonadota bacterium]
MPVPPIPRQFKPRHSGAGLIHLLLFLILSALPVSALAEKTDIVILTNGDRVTGEIKKLEAGILQYKTDTMGTVNIEWRFIQSITTDKQQIIETIEGDRWLGKLQKPDEGDDVQIVTVRGPVEISTRDVVSAWPVEATFWDKIDLSVSVGYDFTNATGITNFNLSSDFLYRTDRHIYDATLRSDITRQAGADDQNRQEFRFAYQRILTAERFRSFLGGYEANDAIGLRSRLYGGAAIGNFFTKTNRNWWNGQVGLIATRETTIEGEKTENIEGILSTRWRYFQFATPERSVDTNLSVFPSLTDTGRWRADFRTTFKLELIVDLFWSMEFYGTYDSDPIDEGAEKSDYGVTTALGWSF